MKFNPVFIEATTLGDCWFQLLSALNEKGRRYKITEGSYKGAERLVFDDVSGFIHYPHEKPLAPIFPENSPLPRPTDDADIEKYFTEYLMDGNKQPNEDYKYATWIVGGEYAIPQIEIEDWDMDLQEYIPYLYTEQKIHVPNQLEWIINHFKEKGFGNEHCYLSVGYPESNFAYDLPYTNEQERKTSPCLRGLDFGIREGYLFTKVIYRSWDLWGGWPVNMGGFTLLNEYVASELDINPGPLSFTCKSLHCYDFQLEVLKARIGK